jgi:ABC-type spermidine/putrescine transport system permease subunit I
VARLRGLGGEPAAAGRARRAGAGLGPLLPLLPLVAFLLVFFVYPVGRVLSLALEAPGVFGELASTPLYRETLARTFRVSLTVTLACLLLGYPVAYVLARGPRRVAAAVLVLVVVPFWISVLGRSFTWLVLLQRNGVVNDLLVALGLTRQPLPLVYNELGVHLGMVHILLPFMVLTLYGVLRGIDPSVLRAASILGATPWQAFWRVFVPLSLPGVAAGTVLLFVTGLGFFITPALLGGGRVTLVAMLIEAHVTQALNWELASALALVLLGATVLVLLPAARVLRFERAFGSR